MGTSTKVAWIVVLISFLVMIWLKQRSLYFTDDEISVWLAQNKLSSIKDKLKRGGIQTTSELMEMKSLTDLHLDANELQLLTVAVDKMRLHRWLVDKGLTNLETQLHHKDILSLKVLAEMSQNKDEMFKGIIWDGQKTKFLSAIESLNPSKSNEPSSHGSSSINVLLVVVLLGLAFTCIIGIYCCISSLVEVVTVTLIQASVYFIMSLLWVIFVGIFGSILSAITGHRVTFPQLPTFSSSNTSSRNASFSFLSSPAGTPSTRTRGSSFHLGLYDRITGRNLDVSKCLLEWNCQNGIEVGNSMVASIHFRCRNGASYQLLPSDNLQVKVLQMSSPRTVLPHAIEPTKITGEELVKVSFTAKIASEYSVNIKLNGMSIGTEPSIVRQYKPGPVDPSKTVFLQESNTIVVTSGLYYNMQIMPKDRFGNMANICQDYLTAEVRKGCQDGDRINPECVVDKVANLYEILLKVEEVGYYVGCVKYEGCIIGPSSINIISLSESDAATVDKNVAKKCNVYYEAQIVGPKPKRVFCFPSPRQIQVKEYVLLGLIPKRVYSCKVCPSTRIIFHDTADKFTLDDGYQTPLVLSSPYREIFAATFYKFLLKNIGGSEKFNDKKKFFYNEVKKLRSHLARSECNISVSRFNLLDDAMSATRNLSSSDWYKKFSIDFQGEEGLDWGGVSREFFELICVRCFDPSHHMFTRFTDNPQALVHPNPRRPSHLKLKHYEFAGRIVGKCLYESALGNTMMVKARFTRSFLAQMIGLRINHKYFESDNPELYTTKIQYIKENDVTDLGLVFAEEEFDITNGGRPTIVPLIEKGDEIDVTNGNKIYYLNLLAQYKLSKCVKDEVDHFLKGLNEIIPDHLLSIFDENELELLMCGMETVSYNDLKIHAVVNGSNAEFLNVVSWFWTLASGFTQEEMAKLLQFVTGCSLLPPGGFKDLQPPFQIISAPTHGRLPTAHTCFNQLCLPRYDSYEQFQQSLMMALNEGSEGFGFA